MTNNTHQDLLGQLTKEEKISLSTGQGNWNTASVERLNVSSVTVSDGPVGLRRERNGKTIPAVAVPAIAKLACSFDVNLLRTVGGMLGEQCRAEGVNILLAPALNIKRDPRCGRNFEYFSEDPLLTAELANAYISGLNSQGVGACIKHFAGNNQEYGRWVVDSVIDDKALREIYLSAFERVIKQSNPCAVMCAYNRFNGEYCSQNKTLLTDILREEWKYDGLVMSDWGATDDRVKGIKAGLDLEMPQGNTDAVMQALNDGTLDEADLNKCVERVLQLSEKFVDNAERLVDFDSQNELARKLSAECTVLVKNNCRLLPLSKTDNIAVIGALAETPVFQGDGSSRVIPYRTDSLLSVIKDNDIDCVYAQGYHTDGSLDDNLLEEARKAATSSDKVILIVGDRLDSEGRDRSCWNLPENQLKLIDAVTSANSNVVLVLQCGSTVNVDFVHSVKAMLIDYYGGEQSGRAIFDVIFGDVAPNGRLAETWPLSLPEFSRSFGTDYKRALYKESIFVGYRYYTTADVPVAFPFGYGLNYNEIKWSKPEINTGDGKNKKSITITLTLQNTGNCLDAETVQVYASNVDNRSFCEKKKLVAFKKVYLKSGESKNVKVSVPIEELAHYDIDKREVVLNAGKYVLYVAKDSNDERFSLDYEIEGDNDTVDCSDKFSCYYNVDENFNPSDSDFLALYGKELVEQDKTVNISTPLNEVKTSFVGKILVNKLTKKLTAEAKYNALAFPLRVFVSDSFSREMLFTVIDMLNGNVMKNLFKLYKQYMVCKKAIKIKNKGRKS